MPDGRVAPRRAAAIARSGGDGSTSSRQAPLDIGNAIRIGTGIAVAAFLGFPFIVRPLVFGMTVEQRIEKTRNPTRLTAFIVDDAIERRLQRLAAHEADVRDRAATTSAGAMATTLFASQRNSRR